MKETYTQKAIDWMKWRKLYLVISTVVIVVGMGNLLINGMNVGVDFTGGALIEYQFEKNISTEEATQKIEETGTKVASIQQSSNNTYLFKLPPIERESEQKITETMKSLSGGEVTVVRFENVGPSIGPELIKKTIYAVLIAMASILFWIAYQFKSLRFGISATLATFHDALVIIGTFSILSKLFGAEADFLFVTAVLTILSFSVHDTIVVFDRIREIRKKNGGELYSVANRALSETMRRSIFNSLAIIFMLISLVAFGGTTTRWFAVALLIGTVSGTYSSPFVAVPLLVTWDQWGKLRKK